jgi:hypothetical protein
MPKTTPQSETDEEALMARLGIIRVPADQYHYKTFRYSKLSDAVAQAEREPQRT